MTPKKLLEIKNLSVCCHTKHGKTDILKNINLSLSTEKIGIVGGSGAGKSILAKAILSLMPHNFSFHAKRFNLLGYDMLNKQSQANFRGNGVAMIMQDPKFALNPVLSIGYQISEVFKVHQNLSKSEAKQATIQALYDVQLEDTLRIYTSYPHELSGGQAQRAMIAMMLAGQPKLLIADEPTSALDAMVGSHIMQLLDALIEQYNMGCLFISHNIHQTQRFCDKLIVMQHGVIVDHFPSDKLELSKHPYTQAMLHCMPDLNHPVDRLLTDSCL